jgi:hypothetical protein
MVVGDLLTVEERSMSRKIKPAHVVVTDQTALGDEISQMLTEVAEQQRELQEEYPEVYEAASTVKAMIDEYCDVFDGEMALRFLDEVHEWIVLTRSNVQSTIEVANLQAKKRKEKK